MSDDRGNSTEEREGEIQTEKKFESQPEAEVIQPIHTPIDTVVDDWWHEHVHGSVLGHDTAAWNYLSSAVEHLRARLRAFSS